MEYREFATQRSRIRICQTNPDSFVEICDREGSSLATFPCSIEDLRAVIEGRVFQIGSEGGSLMAKRSESNLWFVFSVANPPLEDSCLVPCEAVEKALDDLDTGCSGPPLGLLTLMLVGQSLGPLLAYGYWL